MKARLQRVEVFWHDAVSEGGWRDMKDYQKIPLVPLTTVGYLSRYDAKAIQVVQTRSMAKRDGRMPTLDQQRVCDSMTIPRQWAIRVKTLR